MSKGTALPFLKQGDNLVVVIDNRSHTINAKTHLAYAKIVDAIKAQDWDTVRELIEPSKVLIQYGAGRISIQGDQLFIGDVEIVNALAKRICQMYQEGFPIDPMLAFLDNLMENPSARAVNELYGFLEKNNLPITPDGHFLAYKKVSKKSMDVYSGTVPNKLADAFTAEEKAQLPITVKNQVTIAIENGTTVVTMPRNKVNDDKEQTCSMGLHFCSQDYLKHFGGERVMVLKINPRDVVSIPVDYRNAKGRTCRYEIVSEVTSENRSNPDKVFVLSVDSGEAKATA